MKHAAMPIVDCGLRIADSIRPSAWLLFGLFLIAFAGCRQDTPAEPGTLTDTAERGPFSLTVEVTPKQVWVGDPITIRILVETPEDQLVQFPAGDDFGDLEIAGTDTDESRPGVEGGLVWKQTITAEAFISGVVEIPPLAIKYASKPTEPDAEPVFEHELAIDAMEIEVRSALTSQDAVFQPRDITGTLAPPRKPLGPAVWAAIVGGLILAAVLLTLLIVWLRRLANRPAPPILPEVWALRELSRLETAGLIDRGQAKEYYYRLSEIVRKYIELKFALAAPEMTTEEFLIKLARDRGALPYDADRLRAFLEACDLVKYAAFEPHTEQAAQALGSARAFIDATAATTLQREAGGQAA